MPRIRLTKAQKALQEKQMLFVDVLKSFSHQVSEVSFTFPDVKDKASAAHAALVDLAEAIQKVE